jgi:hypothetical protein
MLFPLQKCCTRRPERVLIETTKKHCRKYGHMDGGSNEYRPMVISYIYILYIFILIVFIIFYIVLYFLYMH